MLEISLDPKTFLPLEVRFTYKNSHLSAGQNVVHFHVRTNARTHTHMHAHLSAVLESTRSFLKAARCQYKSCIVHEGPTELTNTIINFLLKHQPIGSTEFTH
jgi:aminoglycoside phosphotransferase family enzyme